MSWNFCFFFQNLCPKSIVFESCRWGIIFLDFVGFPFGTSKLKNDISYIKYKFSHRFGKVCKGLNMYYSKIKIIIFLKVTTMSIWIILKNLVWTCMECKNYRKWATWLCIYPSTFVYNLLYTFTWSQFPTTNKQRQGHDDPILFFPNSHVMGVAINLHNKQATSRS